MDFINRFLETVSDGMYTYILIVLLAAAAVYFSVRTKFVQFRMFPEALRVLGEKRKGDGQVSSFQALMLSTASRVGSGNIAGVATAVAVSTAAGGYGAIFWMWLLALLGAASAFAESTLAQLYKQRKGDGYVGGPAYYIHKALGSRFFGVVFACLLIACFAYGFNALQSFNVSSSLSYFIPDYSRTAWPFVVGGVLALLTALCIFGGAHRIQSVVSALVPVMAALYLALGFFIVAKNIVGVPEMFAKIFSQAFDVQAIFGGFAGSCVMQGIKRGLYSNEAGMGSAPNAAASAEVSHPVKQGLVQMLSVFIDTLLICSTTAFMLLLSGIPIDENVQGMEYVQNAVHRQIGIAGPVFMTVCIFLFAFSSQLGNYYYTESNFRFIRDSSLGLFLFRCTCVAAVFAGCLLDFTTVWSLADILMGMMAIVNLAAIFLLGKKVLIALRDYIRQRKQGKEPVFRYSETGVGDPETWDEASARSWEEQGP